ncbi:MAG TPA: hypothetical protein VHU61_00565, partial [Solirubrobacteraceae bacterium]|nr:hypothetical protein [Solirubrobacteraceae bacterium]
VFTVVSLSASPSSRPKNLIFGSPNKPDLRLRDAVSNDVEIVTNADEYLIYDRPITSDGVALHAQRQGSLQIGWQ